MLASEINASTLYQSWWKEEKLAMDAFQKSCNDFLAEINALNGTFTNQIVVSVNAPPPLQPIPTSGRQLGGTQTGSIGAHQIAPPLQPISSNSSNSSVGQQTPGSGSYGYVGTITLGSSQTLDNYLHLISNGSMGSGTGYVYYKIRVDKIRDLADGSLFYPSHLNNEEVHLVFPDATTKPVTWISSSLYLHEGHLWNSVADLYDAYKDNIVWLFVSKAEADAARDELNRTVQPVISAPTLQPLVPGGIDWNLVVKNMQAWEAKKQQTHRAVTTGLVGVLQNILPSYLFALGVDAYNDAIHWTNSKFSHFKNMSVEEVCLKYCQIYMALEESLPKTKKWYEDNCPGLYRKMAAKPKTQIEVKKAPRGIS